MLCYRHYPGPLRGEARVETKLACSWYKTWVTTVLSVQCFAKCLGLSCSLFSPRFMVYVLGANVSRDARLDQWPGMYVVSAIAYLVSRLTLPLGREARSILAGFAVSVSGQWWSA